MPSSSYSPGPCNQLTHGAGAGKLSGGRFPVQGSGIIREVGKLPRDSTRIMFPYSFYFISNSSWCCKYSIRIADLMERSNRRYGILWPLFASFSNRSVDRLGLCPTHFFASSGRIDSSSTRCDACRILPSVCRKGIGRSCSVPDRELVSDNRNSRHYLRFDETSGLDE